MKLIRIDHVLLILSPPKAQCSECSLTSGYAHILYFSKTESTELTVCSVLQKVMQTKGRGQKWGARIVIGTFDRSRFWEMCVCVCVLVHTFWEVEKTKKYMFLIFVKHRDRQGCSLRLIKKKKKDSTDRPCSASNKFTLYHAKLQRWGEKCKTLNKFSFGYLELINDAWIRNWT